MHDLATKQDLRMHTLATKEDLRQLETRLTVTMGAMVAGGVGIQSLIMMLLKFFG